MLSPQDDLPDIAAGVLAKLREQAPRVHCITNSVAQTLTANVLLAVGAVPSMTIAAAEVTAFVAGAQALLINLGTLDAERRQAIDMTVKQAKERAMPWVLDPAFIDRIDSRAAFARVLARETPHAVRLNAREFLALGGTKPDIAALQHYAPRRGRDDR